MAYPIYMTIGNIPKEICQKSLCCAQMLVGYIPSTKLKGIWTKAGCYCAAMNLFHSCMSVLLGPITALSKMGIPMMSRDGIWCQCHPILANFIGNYPEQVLVTCTYYSECPKCKAPYDQLGDNDEFLSQDYDKALATYALADGNASIFHATCKDNCIKLVYHPFWQFLLHVNIYTSIMPDILHQLLQGVMKHLIAWVSDSLIFGPDCINTRCHLMPPNHQTALFPKGITLLSCISGKEHKNICQILLGLIVDVTHGLCVL